MIDRIAEFSRGLSRTGALKVAEYAFAPITTLGALFGCAPQTGQQETLFAADEFKYRINLETWSDQTIYLFTNDEPSLANSGGSASILRASNVYCPHQQGINDIRKFVARHPETYKNSYLLKGCPEFTPRYEVSTSKRVMVIAQR